MNAGGHLNFNAVFKSPGSTLAGPDFRITEDGADLLFGSFISPVMLTGNINVSDGFAVVTGVGLVVTSGGDAALLGETGVIGDAVLMRIEAVFDFNPNLLSLISNGSVFDSNFVASMNGLLVPLVPTDRGWAPEPNTAVLVAGGLVGLLGIARWTRRTALGR